MRCRPLMHAVVARPGPLRFAGEACPSPRQGAAVGPQPPARGAGRGGAGGGVVGPSAVGGGRSLGGVPVFFGLPAAAVACSWRSWRAGQRGFGLYSAGTAITMLATMALAAAGFGQSPRLVNLGGLFQRASIITGFAWLTALSARALQPAPASRSASSQAA